LPAKLINQKGLADVTSAPHPFFRQTPRNASFHFAIRNPQSAIPISHSAILFLLAFFACTAYNKCMQYTIRRIPDVLDRALRERAQAEAKSMNEIAIEALAEGLGFGNGTQMRRDLSDIVGTWKKDKAFDQAISEQDQIDEDLWK
jgi:hypothetical protein